MKFLMPMMLVSVLLLASCVTSSKPEPEKKPEKAPQMQFSLQHMDPQFLYLAAQRALEQRQPMLAIRFLQTLLKKDSEAIQPRLELVEALLSTGQPQQFHVAKKVLEEMPESVLSSLGDEERSRYRLYYAKALFASGDGEKAQALLLDLLLAHPEHVHVRLLLVRLYVQKKAMAQAHVLLKEGIQIADSLRLRQMQVQLFLQTRQWKLADRALARMQKKYPNHESAVLQRSTLAEKQERLKQAESLLKRFISLQADDVATAQSHSALARFYVRQQRLDEAIIQYQNMLSFTAKPTAIYMALGRLHYSMRHYALATGAFGQVVLQLSPMQNTSPLSDALATAYFYLAASLEAGQTWEEAVPVYALLNAKHTHYLDAQLRLVNIEITQNDEKAAEQRLFQLKALFVANVEIHEVLSSLRLQQKAYETLLVETQEGLDLGYSSVLLFDRAVAFDALKQFEYLDQSLDTVLAQEPNHSAALNFYAYSLAERNMRLGEALVMVKKALELKPNDAYYLDSMAWVYFKQSKYNKALQVQLGAVKQMVDDPVMLEHLGDMYWQVGKHKRARESWEKALLFKHEKAALIQAKIKHGLH